MKIQIKKTLVVLLLVCFLVSLTAIAGSASNGSKSKNETQRWGWISTSWTQTDLDKYTAAKESYYNTGVTEGETKGATDGYNDRKNNKKYDADPKQYHKIASGTGPEAQGRADGYNEGFDKGYLGNDGYEYGWDRADREIGSTGSSSGSIQSCQGPMPHCGGNKFPACIYTNSGSYWTCVRQ